MKKLCPVPFLIKTGTITAFAEIFLFADIFEFEAEPAPGTDYFIQAKITDLKTRVSLVF
jgi:hypothetical protein